MRSRPVSWLDGAGNATPSHPDQSGQWRSRGNNAILQSRGGSGISPDSRVSEPNSTFLLLLDQRINRQPINW